MSKLVTVFVLVGSLVLGVGAGTGWWFVAGAPPAAGSGPGGGATSEPSPTGDGLFHADDLEQFVIGEAQAAESVESGASVSFEPTEELGWCMTSDCAILRIPSCEEFVAGGISGTIEPVAYRAWHVGAAKPGAPVASVDGVHSVMQYADVDQARSEFWRVGGLAEECVAAADSGAAVTHDSADGNVEVVGGYVAKMPSLDAGIPWVTVRRDNIIVTVRFGPNKKPTPEAFESYVAYVVQAAQAAAPIAG